MENWCRDYIVIANDPEEALEKYRNYFMTGIEEAVESVFDPEYIDDAHDIHVYDEDGKLVLWGP